jgi:agmatine/peptidylarginine deiminase
MMPWLLVFLGVGFFPHAAIFARFPRRLEVWRNLLASSTVAFSSLVRCLALPARFYPPLFGIATHRTPSATRTGALRAPARRRY